MPDFLGEFAASVIRKKEGMKDRVLKGAPNARAKVSTGVLI